MAKLFCSKCRTEQPEAGGARRKADVDGSKVWTFCCKECSRVLEVESLEAAARFAGDLCEGLDGIMDRRTLSKIAAQGVKALDRAQSLRKRG